MELGGVLKQNPIILIAGLIWHSWAIPTQDFSFCLWAVCCNLKQVQLLLQGCPLQPQREQAHQSPKAFLGRCHSSWQGFQI
jgi:hypothetical protein